jgi:hypothetical protein
MHRLKLRNPPPFLSAPCMAAPLLISSVLSRQGRSLKSLNRMRLLCKITVAFRRVAAILQQLRESENKLLKWNMAWGK